MDNQNRYSKQLREAIAFSKELNIPNLEWNYIDVTQYDVRGISSLLNNELAHVIPRILPLPYYGNSCLDLTAISFMYLKIKGLCPEMVYGNANIQDSPDNEWSTTKNYLKEEYLTKNKKGAQDIHAWIALGKNIIIDFALPERLWKNYGAPQDLYIPIAEVNFFEEQLGIKYIPMLTGSDFFKKTNGYDPLHDDPFSFKRLFQPLSQEEIKSLIAK